jgi:hypothetical protein
VLLGFADEHAVVPALDFREAVPENGEEILIGRYDGTIEVELDNALGLIECVEGRLECIFSGNEHGVFSGSIEHSIPE